MVISPAMESSPFGQIPTELRLKIWEYALHREDCVRLSHVVANHEKPTRTGDVSGNVSTNDGLELTVYAPNDTMLLDKPASILSLIRTCKQIRDEAMPIFLEFNSFQASCPIFDNSKGHGEISHHATQYHRQGIQTWIHTLDNDNEDWSSQIKHLTIDLGIWRICGCKSSSRSIVDALTEFSADFPPQRNRILKVQFQVQWRAICPCCESDTNDESVWPLVFELERGNNDKFFEGVIEICEGRANWIMAREGLCGRTKMAWLVQLERASARLVEVFRWLGKSGKNWESLRDAEEIEEVGDVIQVGEAQ